ncbi:MAG: hypothetical protein QM820_38040 [Minicystis sp.]
MPTTRSAGVRLRSSAAAAARPAAGSASAAMPKSATRARPSSPTSTLSGLKSRCTSPASCAAASPHPAWRMTSTTSANGRGPRSSHAVKVDPWTSSMATKTRPSCSPISWTATTFGCVSRPSACASRSMASGAAAPRRRTLSATRRSSRSS